MNHVCSRCGRSVATDSRMGSTDVYLTCGCDSDKVWIDDGRGGYYISNAKPITAEEYERRNRDY